MPRLRVNLSGVDGGGGCAKPECRIRAALNRHHKAHEALWFGVWAHRASEPHLRDRQRWQKFMKRYYEFRAEDIVSICTHHHAEIHALYDAVIADDVLATGLPLHLYSWKQGRILMMKLRDTCEVWLLERTPGLDPAFYEANKKAYRRLIYTDRSAAQQLLAKNRARKIRRRRKPRTKRT